ncbi:hypothetical protein WQ54_20410 [Bacillus sp. SA1-12]|uniref:hypothetical protein n=1 Tax=Bacillus sp. SA1-12 TaxID=1455638 RepID=UPI0006271CAB|nr:hypothetical protein [Bacillus sp. SA1-12]KKI90333.1 hypothetical protein WQ54_20410 [Bacillus sp. SA1-12]
MNNLITLFSFLGGRRNVQLLKLFGNKRTNNGRLLVWSLLGLTALGVIGSRNTNWGQKIQEGFNNLRNNTRIPIQNQMNFANEFGEEVFPNMVNKNNKIQ